MGTKRTLQKIRMDKQQGKKALRQKYSSIPSELHSKKYQSGKCLAMMLYTDAGFKRSLPSMTDWLPKWTDAYKKQTPSIDDQRKNHPDSKRTPKRNHPQQLQTHNVPINDVENTNGTNKGGDLLFANKLRTVPRETERTLQGNGRNRRAAIHWSTHSQREQNETKKSSYGVDCLQKVIWYGPAKIDNTV